LNLVKEYIKALDYINLLILIITYNITNSSAFNLI